MQQGLHLVADTPPRREDRCGIAAAWARLSPVSPLLYSFCRTSSSKVHIFAASSIPGTSASTRKPPPLALLPQLRPQANMHQHMSTEEVDHILRQRSANRVGTSNHSSMLSRGRHSVLLPLYRGPASAGTPRIRPMSSGPQKRLPQAGNLRDHPADSPPSEETRPHRCGERCHACRSSQLLLA